MSLTQEEGDDDEKTIVHSAQVLDDVIMFYVSFIIETDASGFLATNSTTSDPRQSIPSVF